MAEPPDGFTEFVAVRSATPLRSAWLLTADAGKAEDLLQTVLGHDHRHHAIGDVADEMADRDALKRALARLSPATARHRRVALRRRPVGSETG